MKVQAQRKTLHAVKVSFFRLYQLQLALDVADLKVKRKPRPEAGLGSFGGSGNSFLDHGNIGRRGDSRFSSSGAPDLRQQGSRTLSQIPILSLTLWAVVLRGSMPTGTEGCPEGKLRVLLVGEDEEAVDQGDMLALEALPSDTTSETIEGTCLALEVAGLGTHQGSLNTFKLEGGLLQPLAIPEAIWEGLSLDFIGGLPMSKGMNVILVVVDRLSKHAPFIALKHPYTAKGVAELFVKEVIRHHGIPKTLVSDRDPLFINGQTKVLNRCVEAYLRCFVVDKPTMWAQWLPWAEFWYNSTFHVSTGIAPFEMVYGRKPPTVFQYGQGEIKVEAVAQELNDRDMTLQLLKHHLANAQSTMKSQADKQMRELRFKVGEWVYVKLHPYRQMSIYKFLSSPPAVTAAALLPPPQLPPQQPAAAAVVCRRKRADCRLGFHHSAANNQD
ncbi:hypothetical protein E3N88_14398 [Mikania micrantha]|uniref:Integrase catalytic domain-containing protein n=1 Tax=Mikania micrantha TaxID=192012 RepID=A0A5N6P2K8_9ASTR|nr:hypothetical protein E3N88_14398 [Mikania micrantha]